MWKILLTEFEGNPRYHWLPCWNEGLSLVIMMAFTAINQFPSVTFKLKFYGWLFLCDWRYKFVNFYLNFFSRFQAKGDPLKTLLPWVKGSLDDNYRYKLMQ